MTMQNKKDFVVFFTVKKSNPNGDPLNGNRPRIDFEGFGEVSDVCIKRKIRNRWMDFGLPIFVQSDDKKQDGYHSLKERFENNEKIKEEKDVDKIAWLACQAWIDVRSFGQVLAFKSKNGKAGEGVSIGVRGPVSIHTATSIETVDISTMQITKSVNSEPGKKNGKSSDTMGSKHRVDFACYKLCGSINVQLAEKTGFSDEDAAYVQRALLSLFENDASSARPEGSMEVNRVYWFEHKSASGELSSAEIHRGIRAEVKKENPPENVFERYDMIEKEYPGFKRKAITEQLIVYQAE